MSDDYKTTLQAAIIEMLNSGKSQNSVARRMGISAATVINIKQGKWSLVSEEMINKCRSFFKFDNWKIVSNFNTSAITNLCMDCQVNHKFQAIPAYTGAGKTTVLREYAKTYENVYMVLATGIMNKKLFLGAIQQAMGIRDGYSVPTMMEAIINTLNSTTDPLLIIDDAGKLSPALFPLIQIIYDATEFNAGIVLAGTEYLEEVIVKGVRQNKYGFRELFRRISYWQPLRHPSLGNVESLCKLYGMTDKYVIQWIHQNAKNYGDIRNFITVALKYQKEHGEDIDREILDRLSVGKHYYNLTKSA